MKPASAEEMEAYRHSREWIRIKAKIADHYDLICGCIPHQIEPRRVPDAFLKAYRKKKDAKLNITRSPELPNEAK